MSNRRHLIIPALAMLGLCGIAAAGVEPSPFMDYQGVLRDDAGAPLDGSFNMVFRFFDAETAGSEILVDQHLAAGTGAVSVSGGLFTVKLGGGAVVDGSGGGTYASLAEVFRDFEPVYLELQVSGETLSPRIEIVSAASALNADHLDGRDSAGFLDTSATSQTKDGDLTLNSDLDVGGQVQIAGGSPASGRVLTSDAAGTATWQDPAPGPPGPPGPEGPEGPQGPAGATSRPVHSITTLDTVGSLDSEEGFISITIGDDGLPVISYFNDTANMKRVAHCTDVACTSATLADVDDRGAGYSSIIIAPDGFPIMSYAGGPDELKVAHCGDVACASATIERPPGFGLYTSITIGTDSLPVISSSNGTDLMITHCSDADCTAATTNTPDSSGDDVGLYSSITIGPEGFPVSSYYNEDRRYLYLALCADATCSSAWSGSLEGGGGLDWGRHTSVAIGTDGSPIISHHEASNGDLRAVHHCSSCFPAAVTTRTTLDAVDDVGEYSSIAIGADGMPVISYHDSTHGALKVARCYDVKCTSSSVTTLDDSGDTGYFTAITIGTDGFPIIAYYDNTLGALKVAHCSNRFCLPNHRPR